MSEKVPHELIDRCAEFLRTLHERGQPENFVHALHQLFRDFERWTVIKKGMGRQLHALMIEEKSNEENRRSLITHTRLHIRKNGESITIDIPIGEIDEWIQKHIQEPERGRIERAARLMSVSIGMDSMPYYFEHSGNSSRTVLLTESEYERFKRFEANYQEIQELIRDKYLERGRDSDE